MVVDGSSEVQERVVSLYWVGVSFEASFSGGMEVLVLLLVMLEMGVERE